MRAMSRLLLASAATLASLVAQAQAHPPDVVLTPLGSQREFVPLGRNPEPHNVCRVGTSQIAAYDPLSRRLFVTDALADPDHNSLDILDIREPLHPVLIERIKVSDLTGSANFDDYEPPGVASAFGLVALAVEANHPVKANGRILLLDHDGRLLRTFDALGSGPERVAFSPNGRYIVAAVQGEQDPADGTDPKGGITVIDLSRGIRRAQARFADFAHFSSQRLAAQGVRIGPDPNDPSKLNPAAFDLEPAQIAVVLQGQAVGPGRGEDRRVERHARVVHLDGVAHTRRLGIAWHEKVSRIALVGGHEERAAVHRERAYPVRHVRAPDGPTRDVQPVLLARIEPVARARMILETERQHRGDCGGPEIDQRQCVVVLQRGKRGV